MVSSSVEEILKKHNLEYRTQGNDYLIRCLNPDHEDSNPSLRIDKDSGIGHCFACGFKLSLQRYFGEVFNFNSLAYKELKTKLRALSVDGAVVLPKGATPFLQEYRGIRPSTFKHFEAFYTLEVDELANRICFPVKNITGQYVFFNCRHKYSNHSPKYINYPADATKMFAPSKLEGKHRSIVLVEGIFDLLRLWQGGAKNAVACFGANVAMQGLEMKMMPYKLQGVNKVYILFDGNNAGYRGYERLAPELEKLGYQVERISLEDGLEPDDLEEEQIKQIVEFTR